MRILEQHYDEMRLYFSWLESYANEEGLFDVGLGDWVAPGGSPPEGPVLSSTAHAFLFASRLADIAEVLGDDERVATYRARAARLRETFNEAFFDSDAGLYRTPGVSEYRQTSNILPLAFGLVPDERIDDVVANLVADIEARDNHLNTGVVGTRYLLPVLTAHGQIDVAYAVATQTTYPSWGYWIEELGRTSLQENWEENTRSLNHHFFGSIGHWLFADLAGISPAEPGWATARVKPHIPSDLDHAEASTETIRGKVEASWHKTSSGLELRVTVPPNAQGEVHVPLIGHPKDDVVASDAATYLEVLDGYAVYSVGSGEWRFVVTDDPSPVCVDPDPSSTVVIGHVDSHVPNRVVVDECTIDDLIDDESKWHSVGAFIHHVNEVLRELHHDGVISVYERIKITLAAIVSGIGSRWG